MSYKSIAELLAQAAATLPNNTTQEISPADVRQMIVDFLDSIAPGYGAITLVSQAIALSAVPVVIPFASEVAATPGVYTTNLGAGAITRLINAAGLAGATDNVIVSGSVSGPNNAVVTLTLFKNGVATPYRTSVTTNGGGDEMSFNINGISYTDGAADAVYTLRASSSNNNNNYAFYNTTMLAQSQPVRSFV